MNILQLILAIQALFSHPPTGVGTGVLGPLHPLLVKFMSTTPLELTTSNQVVAGVWGTVLAIANAFFLLLVLLGSIHMMVSTSTGTLTIPLSQFVPKLITRTRMTQSPPRDPARLHAPADCVLVHADDAETRFARSRAAAERGFCREREPAVCPSLPSAV